jgi:hypothetical protein
VDGVANTGNVTEGNGTYELSGPLPTGNYTVYFSAGSSCAAGNYAFEYYNDAASLPAATPVSVTSGETTTGIDAVM